MLCSRCLINQVRLICISTLSLADILQLSELSDLICPTNEADRFLNGYKFGGVTGVKTFACAYKVGTIVDQMRSVEWLRQQLFFGRFMVLSPILSEVDSVNQR